MPVEIDRTAGVPKRDHIFMNKKAPAYNGNIESRSTSNPVTTLQPFSRKEKTGSIFAFLQKFRVKNKDIFDDVTSLPSTPQSTRRLQNSHSRWESAESVLSSATTNSFAFIPPSQIRGGPRLLHPATIITQKSVEDKPSPSPVPVTIQDKTVFLRRKYNLLGSDVSLCQSEENPKKRKQLVTAFRNSIGNVENIKIDDWNEENTFSTFQYPANSTGVIQRPKSEYNVSSESNKVQRVHCHKPGKGKAPPPPIKNLAEAAELKISPKSTIRKKRKAPSPPSTNKMEVTKTDLTKTEEIEDRENKANTFKDKAERYAVYNDSLRLEKGQLKANKSLTLNPTSSSTTPDSTVPISPKPWYKRNSSRSSKKTNSKSVEKKKTADQLLDEWMLEVGIPRSMLFYDGNETVSFSSQEGQSGNKRRSQISMLANISELDREAAEIVQKEREKKNELAALSDNRFYDSSAICDQNVSWSKYASAKDTNTSRKHSYKDLVSNLNAITNVEKITPSTSSTRDNPSSSSTRKLTLDLKKESSKCRPLEKSDRLTNVETNNLDKKIKIDSIQRGTPLQKSKSVSAVLPSSSQIQNHLSNETPKPVKPFSSWVCPQCTLQNPSWKFICEACNKWRPYSVNKVNGRSSPLVTPKMDVKLQPGNLHKTSLKDRNEINDICKKMPDNEKKAKLNKLDNNKSAEVLKSAQANVPASVKNNNSVEEIRKARLAFFEKNCLNDLNREKDSRKRATFANLINEKQTTNNKYYNEEDRKKLREILKELKDSLPGNDLSGRNNFVKQKSEDASSKNSGSKIAKNDLQKKNNLGKVETKLIKEDKISNCASSVAGKYEPIYSVPVKKSDRPAKRAMNLNGKSMSSKPEEIVEKKSLGETASAAAEIQSTKLQIDDKEGADRNFEKENIISVVKKNEDRLERERMELKQLLDFKGNAISARENKSVTDLRVNRLLRKLQTAIAGGQHHEAANIARELARLKVNCNMTPQEISDSPTDANVNVNLHLRQNSIQLVPVSLKLNSNLSINELKKNISKEYGISSEKQVWMVRGKLIEDESVSLQQMGATNSKILDLYVYSSLDNGHSLSKTRNEAVLNEDATQKPSTSFRNMNYDKPTKSDKVSRVVEPLNIKNNNSPEMPTNLESEDGVTEKNASASIMEVVEKEAKLEKLLLVREIKANPQLETKNKNFQKETQNTIQEPTLEDNFDPMKEWKCSRCTLINSTNDKLCVVCDHPMQIYLFPEQTEHKDEAGPSEKKDEVHVNEIDKMSNYKELVDMENSGLVNNVEEFECTICMSDYKPGDGVILRDCLHTFCKDCLIQTIQYNSEAEVKCPFRNDKYSCDSVLQEREIKALVTPEVYDQHLARSIKEAENKIQNTFHCKTPNCQGWCIFEDNVNEFLCPVCDKMNCLTCQAIHTGLNCKQYQDIIKLESETNAEAQRTQHMLMGMLEKGEAMTCPTCQVIVMKKWGCDWLRCSMCKTEICWVTRGPRWGPQGKGDTSAGCRCGVNGVKCHPRCSYCH